jgi:hypothetical protein
VLPVRPITAPTDGDTADLDNVPELGLSEDVFAGADEPPAPAAEADGADSAGGANSAYGADSAAEAADEPSQAGPDA